MKGGPDSAMPLAGKNILSARKILTHPQPGFAPPSLRSPIASSSQLPTWEGRAAGAGDLGHFSVISVDTDPTPFPSPTWEGRAAEARAGRAAEAGNLGHFSVISVLSV